LLADHLQHRKVVFVQQDGRAGPLLEFLRAAHMVDVAVRQQNLLEREAELVQPAVNAPGLAAGIDDDGLASLFVAQNGAIRLQRTER